jgi:hypothetical protein
MKPLTYIGMAASAALLCRLPVQPAPIPENRVEVLEVLYKEPRNRKQRREKKHGKKHHNHAKPPRVQ